jgi:hypothetical protein
MRSFSAAVVAPLVLFAPLLLTPACSDDPGTSTGGSTGSTSSDAATTSATGTGGSAPVMITEKLADVALTLDGATLTIVVKDGATPVMTDAWLYTLQNGTTLVPITAFDDPVQMRKYRGRMMPCTLSGKPSGLTPCFKGELNGVMTDVKRSKRVGGALQPDLDGTVVVPLSAAPVDPIVVLVGVEDQRYAGVAAIDVGGKSIAAPPGLAVVETHVARTYAQDAAPIFNEHCILCHGKNGAFPYMPLDTHDSVVSFNFGTQNEITACDKNFPGDAVARQACVDAITSVEFFFEAGAPAASPGLRRTRPDELQSTSPEGLAWYGGASRFDGMHGDRRMPPQNVSADPADDQPLPTHFDKVPGDYQILFDWVAQGMMP